MMRNKSSGFILYFAGALALAILVSATLAPAAEVEGPLVVASSR